MASDLTISDDYQVKGTVTLRRARVSWVDDARRKLGILKEKDRLYLLFGASEHKYELGVSLTTDEVENIEKHFSVELPDDYRQFLLQAGNGGAGPGVGLHGIGYRKIEGRIDSSKSPSTEMEIGNRKKKRRYYHDKLASRYFRSANSYWAKPEFLSKEFPLTSDLKTDFETIPEDDDEYDI